MANSLKVRQAEVSMNPLTSRSNMYPMNTLIHPVYVHLIVNGCRELQNTIRMPSCSV